MTNENLIDAVIRAYTRKYPEKSLTPDEVVSSNILCPLPQHSDKDTPSFKVYYDPTNSENANFFCFGCNRYGHLKQFQSFIRGESVGTHSNTPDSIPEYTEHIDGVDFSEYLFDRNITKETQLKFKIKINNKGVLYVPILHDEKILSYMCRHTKPVQPWRHFSGLKKHYSYVKNPSSPRLWICEGQVDAMAIYQCTKDNVLAICGKPLVLTHHYLEGITTIFFAFDSDQAGKRFFESTFERILCDSPQIVKTIVLKKFILDRFKDPSEFYSAGNMINPEYSIDAYYHYTCLDDDIDDCVTKLRRINRLEYLTSVVSKYSVKHMKFFEDLINTNNNWMDTGFNMLFNEDFFDKNKTLDDVVSESKSKNIANIGFKIFDDVYTIREGHVITYSAKAGCGKTIFSLNMAESLIRQKVRQFYISLEMDTDWLKVNFYKIIYGKKNLTETLDDVNEYFKFKGCETMDPPSYESIINLIVHVKKLYPATKIFYIDHLQMISSDTANNKISEFAQQRDFMQKLSSICKRYNIAVVLIVQQTKYGTEKSSSLSENYAGTSAIPQTSSLVFQLDYDPTNANSPYRYVKLFKNRVGSLTEGRLKFENLIFSDDACDTVIDYDSIPAEKSIEETQPQKVQNYGQRLNTMLFSEIAEKSKNQYKPTLISHDDRQNNYLQSILTMTSDPHDRICALKICEILGVTTLKVLRVRLKALFPDWKGMVYEKSIGNFQENTISYFKCSDDLLNVRPITFVPFEPQKDYRKYSTLIPSFQLKLEKEPDVIDDEYRFVFYDCEALASGCFIGVKADNLKYFECDFVGFVNFIKFYKEKVKGKHVVLVAFNDCYDSNLINLSLKRKARTYGDCMQISDELIHFQDIYNKMSKVKSWDEIDSIFKSYELGYHPKKNPLTKLLDVYVYDMKNALATFSRGSFKHICARLGIEWTAKVSDDVHEYCKNDVLNLRKVFIDRKLIENVKVLHELLGNACPTTLTEKISTIVYLKNTFPDGMVLPDVRKVGYIQNFTSSVYTKYNIDKKEDYVKCNDLILKVERGGIHSNKTSIYRSSKVDGDIYEIDFASFYPNIYIRDEFPAFSDETKKILRGKINERIAVKESNPVQSNMLKIFINSIYGNLEKSKYGGKQGLTQLVTCIAQSIMIDFIRTLENHVGYENIEIIDVNTDGIICVIANRMDITPILKESSQKYNIGLDMKLAKTILYSSANNYLIQYEDDTFKDKGSWINGSTYNKLKNYNNDAYNIVNVADILKKVLLAEQIPDPIIMKRYTDTENGMYSYVALNNFPFEVSRESPITMCSPKNQNIISEESHLTPRKLAIELLRMKLDQCGMNEFDIEDTLDYLNYLN